MRKNLYFSVCMITYGHEKFIEQSIEGVLMQECNFEIELIISNDNSPDKTDEIIKKILQNHPKSKIIKYTKHEKNLGMMPNFTWTLKQAKGDYIALCEGDDYWTDPYKLQKQVDFMEKNKEYSICFHSVLIDDSIQKTTYVSGLSKSVDFEEDQILLKKIIHTVSFVFRKDLLNVDFLENLNVFGVDRLLVLLLSEKGKLYFINDIMAVYRIHEGGISNNNHNKMFVENYNLKFIQQYEFFKRRFPKQKKASNIKIIDHCFVLINYYFDNHNVKVFKYIVKVIYLRPNLIINFFRVILNGKK